MKKFLVIAFLITVLRILYLFLNQRDLEVDESQYWFWSQHLAWGYHSKPPMISWIIHFMTAWFGNSEAIIRLFSPIVYFISAFFIFLTSNDLYDRNVGFWAGVSFLLLPGITYSSTIASTDPLLLLFWSISLYAFVKALQKKEVIYWLLCGFCVGLGALSKYTMLVFIFCAFLYLFLDSEKRFWLKRKEPYLFVLLAVLILLPNIIWNLEHHNATIEHVIVHNMDIDGFHLYFSNLFMFIISQFALFGPILCGFLILLCFQSICACNQPRHPMAERSPPLRKVKLLLCFCLPWLIIICIEALLSRAYANWAAIAFVSALIWVVAYLYQHQFKWLKISNLLHVSVWVLFCTWELTLAYHWHQWPFPASDNSTFFGKTVQFWKTFYPNSAYLVDSRDLWSRSIYYAGVDPNKLFVWDPKHKNDWLDIEQDKNIAFGDDFIFLTHHQRLPKEITSQFKSHYRITTVKISKRMQGREDFVNIFWLGGFVGYERTP